ncbi:FecR family protein [Pedobacter sp. AW31-3R]|uniref:FecR family protein n=1 Tax=Pedobacter sp. AW31-3R TaxID=3445781 RepID=UPI003FA1114E
MNTEEVEKLLKKYLDNTCSEEERALLETWYLKEQLQPTGLLSREELQADLSAISEGLPLNRSLPERPSYHLRRLYPVAAAAAVLIVCSLGLYNYMKPKPVVTATTTAAIRPGSNKAFLTLSDGSRIALTAANNGTIANQAGVSVTKTANGQLVYTISEADLSTGRDMYNTIETPKGGQFQVNLPDGTKVWLNAASSLRYPVSFSGQQRKVELTGEGYFEVAKNKSKPFTVSAENQEVKVLGTHFNINAYKDEKGIRTTLLEGRVSVNTTSAQRILTPGQQSLFAGNSLSIKNVDTDISVAWKNGQFMFNYENLQGIMRQVSRWYNVEIVYKKMPSETKLFWGSISRFENVSEVLHVLELTKTVKFKIEGRRIIVM